MPKIVKTCLECNKEFSVWNYRKNSSYWHRRKEVLAKDSIKDLALKELGWKRIVIWEDDVYKKTEKELLRVINEK